MAQLRFVIDVLIILNKKALEKHEENCQNHEAIRIVLPKKDTILEFKNHKHSMRVPIVVYADFGSFTKPIDSCQAFGKLS